jgi:hypothetical protein
VLHFNKCQLITSSQYLDFNARIGKEDAPYTYHDITNQNGNLLVEVMLENNLMTANTHFKKRQNKLWTHEDRATLAKRRLDYILVHRKWWNSMMDAEAYNSFHTVGSDHCIVLMKVRLSLRQLKATSAQKIDWKAFASDLDLQARYTVEVKNKFDELYSFYTSNETPSQRMSTILKMALSLCQSCET